MKVAICDDEENIRELIKKYIASSGEDVQVVEFEDGADFIHSDMLAFQIIFLDIAMKNKNGVEAAEMIRKAQEENQSDGWGSLPLIIFITGYPQYMAEAIDLHAYGYVVKPIDEAVFGRLFRKAVRQCANMQEKNPGSIMVKVGAERMKIPTDEIVYIESARRKNIIHMKEEQIEYYGLIGELEQILQKQFFRIHKGYLVNLKYVKRYDRTQVVVHGGECLLMSKYRYQDFVAAYLEYLK